MWTWIRSRFCEAFSDAYFGRSDNQHMLPPNVRIEVLRQLIAQLHMRVGRVTRQHAMRVRHGP